MKEKAFFIGFLPAPRGMRPLLFLIGAVIIALFGAVGWSIGSTQPDPGPGAFMARETVMGVLEHRPYPMVHVTTGSDRIPAGRTILLSGGGKRGVAERAEVIEGLAFVSGPLIARGELQMIQVRGGNNGLRATDGEVPEIEVEPLGRWRLAGEICDGKCLAGAMRPGTGLAHKACANLCLIGGVPPVFVSSQPVEGEAFMILGHIDGGPLGDEILDSVAVYISVEGTLERRGGALVFLIDPDTIEPI